MSDLRITLLQSNLFWENKTQNLQLFTQKINTIIEATDIIVLPEMFTTGFSMNPKDLSESMDGITVAWMKEQAQKKNSVVLGSFICLDNNKYYNRLLWANPDGGTYFYDKRHLFSMGEEHTYYSSGKEALLIEYKGWKIKPLICYDLRFPVWSRNKNDENRYDLLIYIANWPERRAQAWKKLLPARAIENQCYVVGVNRVGSDGNNITHSGDSALIDFMGTVLSSTKAFEEKAETITLNKEGLLAYRKDFPVLFDADTFEIMINV